MEPDITFMNQRLKAENEQLQEREAQHLMIISKCAEEIRHLKYELYDVYHRIEDLEGRLSNL